MDDSEYTVDPIAVYLANKKHVEKKEDGSKFENISKAAARQPLAPRDNIMDKNKVVLHRFSSPTGAKRSTSPRKRHMNVIVVAGNILFLLGK